MKAPEKIYIQSFNVSEEDTKFSRKLYFDDVWTEEPELGKENIEYTRTDAFIKKAEKFFTEKFEVEDYNDYIDIDGSPIFNYGRFIDDFKNYIKGE